MSGKLASRTSKLRDQLASVALEREQINRQMKELQVEMNKEKNNMEKINRGLRSNALSSVVTELELDALNMSSSNKRKTLVSQGSRGPNMRSSGNFSNLVSSPTSNGSPAHSLGQSSYDTHDYINALAVQNVREVGNYMMQTPIMSINSRVSDWCYTGAFDSVPPYGKSGDVYDFVRWLGRGSFGEVSLIKSKEENHLYAMKTIFAEQASDITKSLKEVQFMRRYRHPYIIDVHDAFLTAHPKNLCIVMYYCEGGDLGKSIASAKKNGNLLNEHQVIKWAIQLALALHYLHENRILHRDLKPSNALLTDGGETLKLADFGLTIELNSGICEHATEAGTPLYTAPEMCNGEKYSYPTDCWSFGIMIHELLALEPPFYKNDTTELVKSILNDNPPELPTNYSPELRMMTKLFLVKDPARRLGFAGMLNDPFLANKISTFPSTYRPKSLEERIRRAHINQLKNQLEIVTTNQSVHSSSISTAELARLEAEATKAAAGGELTTVENSQLTSEEILMMKRPSTTNVNGIASSDNNNQPPRRVSVRRFSVKDHRPSLSQIPESKLNNPETVATSNNSSAKVALKEQSPSVNETSPSIQEAIPSLHKDNSLALGSDVIIVQDPPAIDSDTDSDCEYNIHGPPEAVDVVQSKPNSTTNRSAPTTDDVQTPFPPPSLSPRLSLRAPLSARNDTNESSESIQSLTGIQLIPVSTPGSISARRNSSDLTSPAKTSTPRIRQYLEDAKQVDSIYSPIKQEDE